MPRKLTLKDLSKTPENRRQIRNRIGLLAFLFLLILSLISFNLYHQETREWTNIDSNLSIFLLINLNVILLIVVSLLILRNLIKLIYERQTRKLGFRLKFKLTLAFIIVSTLPMLLFLYITIVFLKNSLDFWFHGQYSVALKNSSAVLEVVEKERKDLLIHFSQQLGKDFAETFSKKKKLDEAELKKWSMLQLERFKLDGVVCYDQEWNPLHKAFLNSAKGSQWDKAFKEFPHPHTMTGSGYLLTPFDTANLHRSFSTLQILSGQFHLEAVNIYDGTSFAELERLRVELGEHENLLYLEGPIRTNYITYLLLFTLLIIFAGTWYGVYLARSIVEPIEILVEGTHRISKGDLDFQIDLQVDDEIGMLLTSFNTMTYELQQNRKKLKQSQDELMQTYSELEERNIFVELVLENIQNGIVFVDKSGYVRGINPYMIDLMRLKQPNLVGRHYKAVFGREQTTVLDQMIGELTNNPESSLKKNIHTKVEGKTLHIAIDLFQLETSKKDPIGRLFVFENLTEIDRSTRARAWREVARRIAHEIKNPLTPIQLSAQRIRKKYLDELKDKELLDNCTLTIINEVYALKNMVNEFSKFARLPEINPSPTDVNSILKEVADLFRPGLPQNIELSLRTDSGVPSVLLDADQIKRVLTNLIDNAVAATEEGGKIELVSRYSKELRIVTIWVVDDGAGIPPEMLSRVFDPYVTTKEEGTGLGLAIVQQIIADHGGFIRAEPNEPKGTRFTIELPA